MIIKNGNFSKMDRPKMKKCKKRNVLFLLTILYEIYKKMSKSVSRVLSLKIVIYLGYISLYISSHTNQDHRASVKSYLGVAPDGVYTASYVTIRAVSSYLAFSSLLNNSGYFLLHFP